MSKLILTKEIPTGVLKVFNDKPEDSAFYQVQQVQQVHGKKILKNDQNQEADGIIISKDQEKIPLAIKTADCIPLTIIGAKGYGMIHAGWRGVQLKIHLEKEVHDINPTYFFIGPHICSKCFTVTNEFYDHFPRSNDCFFSNNGKITFDLALKMRNELQTAFPDSIIETSNKCTFCDLEFNSYRRNKTKQRNWNIYFPS